jgi:hypothetical protein
MHRTQLPLHKPGSPTEAVAPKTGVGLLLVSLLGGPHRNTTQHQATQHKTQNMLVTLSNTRAYFFGTQRCPAGSVCSPSPRSVPEKPLIAIYKPEKGKEGSHEPEK